MVSVSRHTLFFVFPTLVAWNRSKSIITRNCVIDFYRFPLFFDWLVSNSIDNDTLLSTLKRHVTSCCPAHFWQPTSSNSFPMCIRFDLGEVPEIPMAEFSTQERLNDHRKNLPINLGTKIVEDFVAEEGDFVTGNIFCWFESNLTMLGGKELDDVKAKRKWAG